MQHGFIKVAAATPRIKVANPDFNAERALDVIKKCVDKYPDIKLVGNTKTFSMLPQYFNIKDLDIKKVVVGERE